MEFMEIVWLIFKIEHTGKQELEFGSQFCTPETKFGYYI